MPKTPRLTAREVIKQLKQSGFVEVSQTLLINFIHRF